MSDEDFIEKFRKKMLADMQEVTDAYKEEIPRMKSAEDKYVYFLLSAAAAAIAYVAHLTENDALSWNHLSLGCAVILWIASFIFGCQNRKNALWLGIRGLEYDSIKVAADFELTLMDPMRENSELRKAAQEAIELVKDRHKELYDKVRWSFEVQFFCLVAGGVFFLLWHVFRMAAHAQLMA